MMVDRRQVQIARQATFSPFPSSTTTTTSIPPTSTTFSSTPPSPSTSSAAVDIGFSPNDGYSIVAVSTNAAGSVVYTTVSVTVTVSSTSTISAQPSSSSSTPIAAIIGGVVGGVVVLVVIALLIYFIRKHSSKNEFDGDYEPDRIIRGGSLPQLDLSDEANNIIPFNAYAADEDEEMQQYGRSPFASGPSLAGVTVAQTKHQIPDSSFPPSLASYDSDGQFYLQGASSGHLPGQSLLPGPPQGAAFPAGQYAQLKQLFMHDAAPAHWYTRLGSSLSPSTVPSASASLGCTKEPETAGERDAYGLGLAAQCEPQEHSEFPLGPAGGRVVVHRDAGRAPEDPPHEIPPAYDSIQR
ncbi:hypothetical protein EDD15DRAFT_2301092 [Pisolithus albus]|nr:hypothetical protein EDD15DRAFT_2301092 [Pisolithus albus]